MDDRNYNDNADNAYWSEIFSKAGAQVAMKVLPQGVLPSSCGLKPETTTEQYAVDGEAMDKKRPAPIPVRASQQQKILIKAKATAAGVAVSCYMLIAALGCDYKPPRDPELVQVLLKLNRELTAQGNNLNQIAHHMNSGQSSPTEGVSLLAIISRSLLQAHQKVRDALSWGKAPES